MPKISLKFRFLLLGFAFLGLQSCDKTWQCKCLMATGGEQYIIIDKATEKEAEEVCSMRAERKVNGDLPTSCTLDGKYKGNQI